LNAAFATVKANTADDRARVNSLQSLHKRVLER